MVIDGHSKWVELKHMNSTTAQKTIEVLRILFNAYGTPEKIVSNNGPDEYVQFVNLNAIKA